VHELLRRCTWCRARMTELGGYRFAPTRHVCAEACAERIRRDVAARPDAESGISLERRRGSTSSMNLPTSRKAGSRPVERWVIGRKLKPLCGLTENGLSLW
jgi:hypothetical protein